MFRPIAASAACLLLVSACSTTPSPITTRPMIPPNLTQPCPPLPALRDGSFPAVAAHLARVSGLYYECRAKHSALANRTTPRTPTENKEEK